VPKFSTQAQPRILLASASPRRQELLSQIGISFETASQNIDESQLAGESASAYVRRMATEKAESALKGVSPQSNWLVVAADTIVVCDEEVFGQPTGRSNAMDMLLQLSDREHKVLTAVTIASTARLESCVAESVVSFREISPAEASAYWRTGEPAGKAGGYAIQGYAAVFVKKLNGSYSAVVGLPLYETM
jgi:septum formation protein